MGFDDVGRKLREKEKRRRKKKKEKEKRKGKNASRVEKRRICRVHNLRDTEYGNDDLCVTKLETIHTSIIHTQT